MTNGVFKSSAKAHIADTLRPNASCDDLVRRIEVRILPDDFNASAESPKKIVSSSSKSTTSSSLKTEISISTAARSERSYPATHSKREKSSSTTQSMSSKRSSYNPVLPKKRMENGSDSMQQFNRLNFNKQHLGIHSPTTHRYNSRYMRNKYNQRDEQDWETQSAITPILEDPFGGPDLYRNTKDNLKPFSPKLKFVKKSSPASSSSSDSTQKTLRSPTPFARSSVSRLSALSDVVFEDDREDDECSVIINVLDGKTVRIRNADNQYLTGYQHSDHINPKYRFTDRVNEDSDQLFTIETVRGNSCVLVSVLKHVGYIKPALFYSPLTKDLQLRDYYPYCPKERKYFTAGGNSSQSKNFLFECSNYNVELPGFGITDLEIIHD